MNTDTRNDEELNHIIAEWCGWKTGHTGFWIDGTVIEYRWGWTPPVNLLNTEPKYTPGKCNPPDYCRDLNACHEAEGKLTYAQVTEYVTTLRGLQTTEEWKGCFGAHATARQRAEALVKVIEQQKGQK